MKRGIGFCLVPWLLLFASVGYTHNSKSSEASEILREADAKAGHHSSSPVRRITRDTKSKSPKRHQSSNVPTYDGSGNHRKHGQMNATHTPLRRFMKPDYEDLISAMAGSSRPSPRAISNIVNSQTALRTNTKRASDFLWQWGQFLDHDLDLSEGVFPPENASIPVPVGDAHFDPQASGQQYIAFNRTIYAEDSGTDTHNPRQQLNEISGWIDASNVYGSDHDRAQALRTLDGSGKLKTSSGDLLPFNTMALPNGGGDSEHLFVAGDVRANEQVGLTAMHTLFVREHNRLAEFYARRDRRLSGEEIYQLARREVMAQMQAITYNEFIPVLLGKNALNPYRGYNRRVDARIMNSFSTAAYRLGHSLLSPRILRLDQRGKEIAQGHLPLRDAFFSPSKISSEGGIDPILRGLARQACQELDVFVIDDVRNFLFGLPGQGGFDLASLNIQRGRDHGLPSYNDARMYMGLSRITEFEQISSDPDVQSRLRQAYYSVDEIDLWVGGLAEDHFKDALVGELFFTILKQQFENLRDGDRFWYQRSLDRKTLWKVEKTRLADIIRRNTEIGREIQSNVFIVPRRFHR